MDSFFKKPREQYSHIIVENECRIRGLGKVVVGKPVNCSASFLNKDGRVDITIVRNNINIGQGILDFRKGLRGSDSFNFSLERLENTMNLSVATAIEYDTNNISIKENDLLIFTNKLFYKS